MNRTNLRPDFVPAEGLSPPKSLQGPLRVAAYIRVSTDSSDQENSYETQERYFRRLLGCNSQWVSAGVYADHGVSGTLQQRSGFRRLLRHCAEGKIDRVICKSISRFARNTKDFMEALNLLRAQGVSILFEREGLDTADLSSSFILTTLAAIAQEESRSLSENLRWSNQKRFPKGLVPNRALYGYRFGPELSLGPEGYRCRSLEIVPEEAEVLRWIFEQAARGAGYREIARQLNRRQIPRRPSAYTRQRQQLPQKGQLYSHLEEGWTDSQVRGILHNERYTGDVLVQKTYTEDYLSHRSRRNKGQLDRYLVRDHHPAIISRELFAAAQQALPRGQNGPGGNLAFSGRLICGNCGRFYHVRNTRRNALWFCPSAALHNGQDLCRSQPLYQEQLLLMLRKALSLRFGSGDLVEELLALLRHSQRQDCVERDRALLQGQLLAAQGAGDWVLAQSLEQRLRASEAYWEELEDSYPSRQEAIAWMEGLPPGQEGARAFLQGLEERYVPAFVLSVTVYDPLRYSVHWFDDSRTQLRLDCDPYGEEKNT